MTAAAATAQGSATAGSFSTTDGSMADTTAGGPTIELEGLLQYCDDCFDQHTYFRPCGTTTAWCLTGDWQEIWMCSGAYARIRGHFEGGGNTFLDSPCPDEVLHVDEVLETRLCEPTDCGGTRCEAVQGADASSSASITGSPPQRGTVITWTRDPSDENARIKTCSPTRPAMIPSLGSSSRSTGPTSPQLRG